MGRHIRKVYIVHHSHTDVGYTDLQEQVIYNQVQNIRTAVELRNAVLRGAVFKDCAGGGEGGLFPAGETGENRNFSYLPEL